MRRGEDLKSRFAVKGIQWDSRELAAWVGDSSMVVDSFIIVYYSVSGLGAKFSTNFLFASTNIGAIVSGGGN